jgi:hypothetical protein
MDIIYNFVQKISGCINSFLDNPEDISEVEVVKIEEIIGDDL